MKQNYSIAPSQSREHDLAYMGSWTEDHNLHVHADHTAAAKYLTAAAVAVTEKDKNHGNGDKDTKGKAVDKKDDANGKGKENMLERYLTQEAHEEPWVPGRGL